MTKKKQLQRIKTKGEEFRSKAVKKYIPTKKNIIQSASYEERFIEFLKSRYIEYDENICRIELSMKKTSIIFTLLFSVTIFAGLVGAQTNSNAQEDKVYKLSEVDEKPEITKKKQASTRGKCNRTGRARVRVVLRKSGEVTDPELVTISPCRAFNESVLKVVKKIKFKPATRNFQPVSVSVVIEYVYVVE